MIYFIQEDGTLNIKIGFTGSDDTEQRRKELQTGNPNRLVLLTTCEGTKAFEQQLHGQFSQAKVNGEWFRPVPGLLQFIISRAAVGYAAGVFREVVDRFEADRVRDELTKARQELAAGRMEEAEMAVHDLRRDGHELYVQEGPDGQALAVKPGAGPEWRDYIKGTPGLKEAMIEVLLSQRRKRDES